MTLTEKYDALIRRTHLPTNAEKYHHLINSPNKSEVEEDIIKLDEKIKSNFDMLNENKECNIDKESIENNISHFLKNFEALLDKENWTK